MTEPSSRGERRKRETRRRLLRAAFRLFAERGADAVAINEITEAADVGFGSFYNHFPSKDAILAAVLGEVFDGFADALDRLTEGIDDPAAVIAISIRHAIQRAEREPLWGTLLVRESYEGQGLARGLGPRLLRDVARGIERGRFVVADPMVAFLMVGSTVLGAITAQRLPPDAVPKSARGIFDRDAGALDVRIAAAALTVLGLTRAKAVAIASRELPTLPPPTPE